MAVREVSGKVRVAVMNAVHDLPVLVARDQGYFEDEGLEIEIVTAPGTAQMSSDHGAMRGVVFDRTMESLYNDGEVDQYRMCEWGVMKRTVEAAEQGQRPAKIVALGAAMSSFALVAAPDGDIYEPEQLKDRPVAVSPFNGSHFTTLKMLEGFIEQQHIQTVNAGTMMERLDQLRRGEIAAASLMEPWISVAQRQGFRVLIETHSSRSEASRDDLDSSTLAAMFRAQARAADAINADRASYAHYLLAEVEGLLEPEDFAAWRLLHAHPARYTRQRFEDTYRWMRRWDLVSAGAEYDAVVDNRAWD